MPHCPIESINADPPIDGECAQTLVHPAISVWTVSTMPNGDIVTGCSDGVVRIFSASEERWASAGQIEAYDQQVASTALPAQQVGDVKKSDLPGLEALSQPGSLLMVLLYVVTDTYSN